jgi:hypothetical protein
MLNDCATLGSSPAWQKLTDIRPEADAFPSKATLRAAFDEAVREIDRGREGPMLTNGFYSEIGTSVFEASYQALQDFSASQEADAVPAPRLHVVSAPAGGGKTSFSIAMLTALVRATSDTSEPMGGLFLADQRKRADDTYRELSKLLPGQVAIWTADHDAKSPKAEKVTDPAKRFSVDDLERFPVVVVTHEFFKGKRGHKAREWIAGGQKRPRALIFVDERPNDVRVFDVQLSQAEAVLEHVQADEANRDSVTPHLSKLLGFMRDRTQHSPDLEKPTDDAKAWSVSDDLWWFRTVDAGHYAKQNGRAVPSIAQVFGFARSVAEGYAFIARSHGGKGGTRFIGYQSDLLLGHGMVLLDATADIDGVQQVCPWRMLQPMPRARYDNLHIVHVPSFTRESFRASSGNSGTAPNMSGGCVASSLTTWSADSGP